jgi:hypothetical protein
MKLHAHTHGHYPEGEGEGAPTLTAILCTVGRVVPAFAHIGVPGDEQGACVGVNGGQAGQMLANFFQICQTGGLLSHQCAHPGHQIACFMKHR